MTKNQRLSEVLGLAGKISPQLVDNNNVASEYVDMSKVALALGIVLLGATDITVDAKIEQAQDGSGTGLKDLKTITQLTATDDNKQVLINIRPEELDEGFTHVRLKITVGDGTSGGNVAGAILVAQARFGPESALNLASVAQIKA